MTDENPDAVFDLNLFGETWYRSKGKKGRPPFQWTIENSNKVNMLLAAGWSNARIAGVILDPRTGKSISEPTLKRHFRSELAIRGAARDRMLAEQMMRVWASAQQGNVGAERLFGQMMERNDRMEADRVYAKEPKAKVEKLGKKMIDERKAYDADEALQAELDQEASHNVKH